MIPCIKFLILSMALLATSVREASCADPRLTTGGYVDFSLGEQARQSIMLGGEWLFSKNGTGERPGVKEKISIPHVFDSGAGSNLGKVGYRKEFQIPESWRGKRVALYIERLQGTGTIRIDGKEVAAYPGGGIPLTMPLQSAAPGNHMLELELEGSEEEGRPGITGSICLFATGDVYISEPGGAAPDNGGGIFFRTLKYDPKTGRAETRVRVHVDNQGSEARELVVSAVMAPKGGFELSGNEGSISLDPGKAGEVSFNIPLAKARVWTPATPRIYTLIVTLYEKKGKNEPQALLDARTLNVGVRTISLDGQGLLLNGRPVTEKLAGFNRREVFPGCGRAMPPELHWRDAVRLKESGVNLVRSDDRPMSPAFLDACDHLGIFVVAATSGNHGKLARRDRNRACVLMWEPFPQEGNPSTEVVEEAAKAVREELGDSACFIAGRMQQELAGIYDVYLVDGLADNLNNGSARTLYGNKAVLSLINAAHGRRSASRGWGEGPMLAQAVEVLGTFSQVDSAPGWLCGVINSHAIDPSCDREQNLLPFEGLLDSWRQPKMAAEMLAASRSGEPSLYIATALSPFSGADVLIAGNCDKVKVRANDGGWIQADRVFKGLYKATGVTGDDSWLGPEEKKGNSLDAEGSSGKSTFNSKLVSVVEPAEIRLKTGHGDLVITARRGGMVVIDAGIVDAAGVVDRLYGGTVQVNVKGPASLCEQGGLPNGRIPVSWGTAPIVLRLDGEPGRVTVEASSRQAGMPEAITGRIDIEIEPDSYGQSANGIEKTE